MLTLTDQDLLREHDYIKKFLTLTRRYSITKKESDRFLKVVQNLKKLKSRSIK